MIQNIARISRAEEIRLVRDSHIVTKRLYDHDKCYFFQGRDDRVMFAIPYEEEFTLIDTTEAEHSDISAKPRTQAEIDYMIDFVNT